jgi:hypothetical protein
MSKDWKLMKLAFDYYSLGFQRIIFMILGAELAFLMLYLYWLNLYREALSALPSGTVFGGETIAGAMVIAGVAAVGVTIKVLLLLAAIGLVVGYVRHYLVVLSYYDEEKYAGYRKYRSGPTPAWLMEYDIGRGAEQERQAAVESCKKRCKAIRDGID